ncbi:FUSC family protein [Salinibacterium hongtaonis]|uniref:Integral membrane bound transporter domain-containing protein n=1 Tax=Homoserinimonas hongtaonis TaxID=2079791 RepID=A0A2U1SZ53_9MICO|nr:aromatic acid exporter family protein [Salinibacterium hongtaonis]AWB89427.1 hypothetical protein C2138_07640 [Salinibacterium hongtaonis]PWB96878.1 hypothetical protein DF220_02795 [Salinibacterium hongtaonis]
MRPFATVRATARAPVIQVVKTSVAIIVSWLICAPLLSQPLPVFAAIAALLVMQPSVTQSLSKGIERSLGVILGVVLAYGAGLLFGHSSFVVLILIVVAIVLSWALRLSPGSANQIPISAMIVLAVGGGDNPAYAAERIIETIIGAVVALIVNMAIVPPVQVAPAVTSVKRLAAQVAESLDALADALMTVTPRDQLSAMLTHARSLRPLQKSAAEAISNAEESLLLNPRSAKHRAQLARLRDLLSRLDVLVTRAIGMTRAVHDHYDAGLPQEPIAASIARELTRAAHDLRLLAEIATASEKAPSPTVVEPPALTSPLSVAAPHPEHWILIGSLLEDLRRVREAIIDEADS